MKIKRRILMKIEVRGRNGYTCRHYTLCLCSEYLIKHINFYMWLNAKTVVTVAKRNNIYSSCYYQRLGIPPFGSPWPGGEAGRRGRDVHFGVVRCQGHAGPGSTSLWHWHSPSRSQNPLRRRPFCSSCRLRWRPSCCPRKNGRNTDPIQLLIAIVNICI